MNYVPLKMRLRFSADYRMQYSVLICGAIFVRRCLKVAEEARARNKKINPVCPYANKIMAGKDEYADVLL